MLPGREQFLGQIRAWLGPVSRVETAEFEIIGIEVISSDPLAVRLNIRYDLVAYRNNEQREDRYDRDRGGSEARQRAHEGCWAVRSMIR